MSDGPLAAIVVPTHDHAATLDLAVGSALDQTVEEIEVIVVGDGVGDDTREVVSKLADEDPRVHFMDFPKGPHHGEIYRGRAVLATKAKIVTYLCDDDLLLPEHVESMAELLVEADLAHSENGYVDANGSWHACFADLSSPDCRAWVLQPGNNVVSLTGTAHTVAAYAKLPHGWRTTPPGHWADHYMWQQFLAEPWVRAITATRVTAVQFPSHVDGRDRWQAKERRAELEAWRASLATEEGRADFNRSVRRATATRSTAEWLRRDQLEKTLAEIESTRTWRLRNALKR
jgi:glycosyltransferase involved in cell wall biosynthesis